MSILTCYAKGKTFEITTLPLEAHPEAAGGGVYGVFDLIRTILQR